MSATKQLATPWPMSTVGHHFDIQLGKMLDAARNVGQPKPYLGNRAVQWGRIDISAVGVVPLTSRDQARFHLQRNDLLVCEGGEVGRAAIWKEELRECYYQKALHRLRPKTGYDPRVMLALLEYWSTSNGFSSYVTQTSIAHLPRVKFLMMPLPVIPTDEQERIGRVIDDINELVVRLERMIAKKQAIKQGIMQQLLTGKVRLPGFTSGTWKARPLRESVSLISGTHVMAKDCNTQGIGTPYLTGPADFPDGQIKQTKFTTRPISLCRAGDILITVKGSGSGTMVEADAEYCISRQLMALRSSERDSRFLFCSLLHNASQIKAASAGLIPGLSRSDILDQELPIPPNVAEQGAIAEALLAIDHQIESLKRLSAKKEAVKQGMMQHLLTGRTRLPAKEGVA